MAAQAERKELEWRRIAPQDYRTTLPNGAEARVSARFVDDRDYDGGSAMWEWFATVDGQHVEECLYSRMYEAKSAVQRWADKQCVTQAETPLRIAHVRKQINPSRVRGNGFYAVQLGATDNGSQTFCGAPAGKDLSYAEAAARRPDFDWTAHFASLSKSDLMFSMVVCCDCLREALKLKEQRAQARQRRPRTVV